MERTLVLIKPDGVERALIGKIISRFEDAGLKVVAMKLLKPTEDLVGRHYVDDKEWLESVGKKTKESQEAKGIKVNESAIEIGTRIRKYLINYLVDKPVVAMVIEGNDAVAAVRKITGSTAPNNADPSTIRGMYSTDSYSFADSRGRPVKNLIHASDKPETAEKEIKVWFNEAEIIHYKRSDEETIY